MLRPAQLIDLLSKVPSQNLQSDDEANDRTLAALVGTSRVIALGESFHHTHELIESRARLVRALVRAGGVRRILLEAVRPGPGPIQDFLDGSRSNGSSALAEAGARMWQNRETLRLLEWVRAFNLEHPQDPVRTGGIDILAPGASMRVLAELLPPVESDWIVACSHSFDQDGRADQAAFNQLSARDRGRLIQIFEKLETSPRLGHHDLTETGRVAEQRRHCRVVNQSLAMLEAGSSGWTNGFAVRDRALAENALNALELTKERALILSHNLHVNALAWRQAPARYAITPMGQILKGRLGAEYLCIGTTFGLADFATPIYGIRTLAAAGSGTIDEALDAISTEPTLFDIRPVNQRASEDSEVSMMGLSASGESQLVYRNLGQAFDLLLHVPHVQNADQLFATDLDLDVAAVDASRSH